MRSLDSYINELEITTLQAELILKYKEPNADYIRALQRRIKSCKYLVNEVFDEVYYLMFNRDILQHIFSGQGVSSGLHHFLGWGIYEGRAPMRGSDLRKVSEAMRHHDKALRGESNLTFEELCKELEFIDPTALAACYLPEFVNSFNKGLRTVNLALAAFIEGPLFHRAVQRSQLSPICNSFHFLMQQA